MKLLRIYSLVGVLLLLSFFSLAQDTGVEWKDFFTKQLGSMGHRNWVLVVDAAYPLHSKPGVETIVTGESPFDVLDFVLSEIDNVSHVEAKAFLDKEIDFVSDDVLKEVCKYKETLDRKLESYNVTKKLHEELLRLMDETSEKYQIIILKTNSNVPYTSVFIRLDCGYWNDEKESQLRAKMK